MATFDRFDICEAHHVLESDFNVGGWLRERPSNQRRKEATHIQLARIQFKPAPSLSYETLSENGKEIYWDLVETYRLMSGYHDCTCRDCFETAIGASNQGLCGECADAGCEAYSETECSVEHFEEEEEEQDEPGEDDWTTTDHKAFYQNGKRVLTLTGEETSAEMWVAIRRAMNDANYFPGVWFISDHGNAHLMSEE
jgi:hypothetical protein